MSDGKLVVAHAGLKEEMQGRASTRVREFALYGETTGESDEFGRPIRLDWVQNYRGGASVVYGHVAVTEARAPAEGAGRLHRRGTLAAA